MSVSLPSSLDLCKKFGKNLFFESFPFESEDIPGKSMENYLPNKKRMSLSELSDELIFSITHHLNLADIRELILINSRFHPSEKFWQDRGYFEFKSFSKTHSTWLESYLHRYFPQLFLFSENSEDIQKISFEKNLKQIASNDFIIHQYHHGVTVFNHNLILDQDGQVWEFEKSNTPRRVSIPSQIQQVDCGNYHRFALDVDGRVWKWSMTEHPLNQSSENSSSCLPQILNFPLSIQKIVCCRGSTLFLDCSGEVWGLGENNSGELGIGHSTYAQEPEKSPSLSQIVDIDLGVCHGLALDSSGEVWSFGGNQRSQLGRDVTNNTSIPGKISLGRKVQKIACGSFHSLILDQNHEVTVFGENNECQGLSAEDIWAGEDVSILSSGKNFQVYGKSSEKIQKCVNGLNQILSWSGNSEHAWILGT